MNIPDFMEWYEQFGSSLPRVDMSDDQYVEYINSSYEEFVAECTCLAYEEHKDAQILSTN